MNKKSHIYDVIIIGAGIAGATCAYRLAKYGHTNILVLEAESQVGGRILSIDTNHDKSKKTNIVELGPRWIHDVCSRNDTHLTLSMAKEVGVKWNTLKDSVDKYIYNMVDDSNIKLPSDILTNKKYRNSIIADAFSVDDDGFPAAYLENDRNPSNIRTPPCENPKSKSESNMHYDLFVTDGYIKLVHALLKNINVKCNYQVTDISHKKINDLYCIVCSNEIQFFTKHVVVTLPPSAVLKLRIPSLPTSVRKALKSIHMCHYQQAVFTLKNRSWGRTGKLYIDPLSARSRYMYGEKLLLLPYASQIVYSWLTWTYVKMNKKTIYNRGCRFICNVEPYYRGKIKDEVTDFQCSDWENSYSSGDFYQERSHLQKNLNDGGIYFAGEHTSTTRYGFVDGAIESGKRVSDQINVRTRNL